MTIADVARGERGFNISWNDQSEAELPFIWLRDNDPDDLHPQTREREFNLTSVELDISPISFALEDGGLRVGWPNKERESFYSTDWLRAHQPGRTRHDPADVRKSLWDRESIGEIPRFDIDDCKSNAAMLKLALLRLKETGLVIIAGLGNDPMAAESFGDLIGFKRETNFGTMFDVVSMTQPNNLAYTSVALPLHTDLPNQEAVPGYQFLHSVKNEANGGDSIFADGFRICADLRDAAPDDFELITKIQLPFRFHDETCDLRQHRPIISLLENGDFDRFTFNAHIADVLDIPASLQYEFYRAYRNLMLRIRGDRYSIQHTLTPGEMVIFDNSRVLHGRTAFDAGSGERHFRGYYIERNEVDSRIRMLARE